MSKRLLTLTVVLLLIATINSNGYAQNKPLMFGVVAGSNFTFTNVEVAGLDRALKIGLGAGGTIQYWFSHRFAVEGNVLYSMKGAKFEESVSAYGVTASAEVNWKFNYLSFPVLAKIAFGENTKFYIDLGFELAFLLSAKQKFKAEVMGQSEEEETDIKDYMNSVDFGTHSGMGVAIPLNNMVLSIGSRGSLSLTDIFKEKELMGLEEDEAGRNLVAALYLSLLF